ncbi:MAG: MoaA/NifB/PqqE/SkfB family radical SAM enzyme [Planctomycetota bacterium]|jgi:MoaA/NifB/PqqE/SkfB family radical SAM enzyme
MNEFIRWSHDVGAAIARRSTVARRVLHGVREIAQVAQHSLAKRAPKLIRADTVNLTVALTARCNQRCTGCLYERGFMTGKQLSRQVLDDLVDDAAELGVRSIRLYGGEPLLHPDLAHVVRRAVDKGLATYVTTNGVLLENKIDELFDAGLRHLTFGYYGTGDAYDKYTQRPGTYERLERGVRAVRERYGASVSMRMNWLLMRPTCTMESLGEAVAFARRYDTPMQVDLVHYSLPYFTEGPERELQFRPEDREAIEVIVAELLRLKREEPRRIENSEIGLRAIPDWLLNAADMKVPCDKYRMVWVGADGTVQLCYVTFRLGQLGGKRLRDLLYTDEHHEAARGAFNLNCPNCHCGFDDRTRKHLPSRRRYNHD